MTDALTTVERKVYHYLLDFLSEHTYQPSVREIGRTFRIKSTKTVSEILQSIANKGFIERDPARSRGVRLIGFQSVRRTMPVPVHTSGPPGEARASGDQPESYITVDRRFLPGDAVFFTRASNGGAPEHGILSGDYVLVNPAAVPRPGDLVVERHGTATVVRSTAHAHVAAGGFSEPGGQHNVTTVEEESVLGVVCGVFRAMCEVTEAEPDGEEA